MGDEVKIVPMSVSQAVPFVLAQSSQRREVYLGYEQAGGQPADAEENECLVPLPLSALSCPRAPASGAAGFASAS